MMSSTDRLYISTADFQAPYDAANLSGLGSSGYDVKRGVFGPGGHGGGIFQTTVSGLGNLTPRQKVALRRHLRARGSAPAAAGLGAWPKGRSYWSTAHFRAPYDQGYFQDNNLMGIEDAKVVLRQIPTWAYAGVGVLGMYYAWKKYKAPKTKEASSK